MTGFSPEWLALRAPADARARAGSLLPDISGRRKVKVIDLGAGSAGNFRFLAPRLHGRFGFAGGSIATGLLWSAWHVPELFLANFGGETPRAFAIACFTASLVGMSFVYSWLRLRTDSLWPAVVLHASHNVFITPIFSMLTVANARTPWAIDEFGYLLAIASLLMAFVAWRQRARLAG